ncbi:MAG: NAD(P)H-hydrate epimerase [Phycisphaeraceae bacterium]
MIALTREQVRQIDRLAVESLAIPSIVLMENAARNTAQEILLLLEEELHLIANDAKVAIVCGGGNNGGDGLAIARHLHNHGAAVDVYLTKQPEELEGDAATNLAIVHRMGLPILVITNDADLGSAAEQWREAHVLVDASLGTGFAGPVREPLAGVIAQCNAAGQHGVKIVAVDVPSGLDCDTGEPGNATIVANLTVTFVAMKVGFAQPAAEPYVGQVVVVDIGTPPSLMMEVLRQPQ